MSFGAKNKLIKVQRKKAIQFALLLCEDIDIVKNINIDDTQIKNQMYILMSKYLKLNKIEYSVEPVNSQLKLIHDILPDWLFGQDDSWFNILISSSPINIVEDKLKDYYLGKILEAFLYEKTPPNWLQNSEWPIIDNQPLLFIGQDGEPESIVKSKFDHKITYYFVNQNSGLSYEVEQYD